MVEESIETGGGWPYKELVLGHATWRVQAEVPKEKVKFGDKKIAGRQ